MLRRHFDPWSAFLQRHLTFCEEGEQAHSKTHITHSCQISAESMLSAVPNTSTLCLLSSPKPSSQVLWSFLEKGEPTQRHTISSLGRPRSEEIGMPTVHLAPAVAGDFVLCRFGRCLAKGRAVQIKRGRTKHKAQKIGLHDSFSGSEALL